MERSRSRSRMSSGSSNRPPKPSTVEGNPKSFGANKLMIGEEVASRLIGGIVEKGISDNHPQTKPTTLPPNPTVLPFPLARHRSHGPHWSPVSSVQGGRYDNEDEEADDEDDDPADFEPISAFANPVQRKQKKGLDLSQWRELMSSDNSLETDKMEESRVRLKRTGKERKGQGKLDGADKNSSFESSLTSSVPMEVNVEPNLNSSRFSNEVSDTTLSGNNAGSFVPAADMEIDNSHQLKLQGNVRHANYGPLTGAAGSIERMVGNDVPRANKDPASAEILKKGEQSTSTIISGSSLNNFGNIQGSMSLESEIDAENRARLQRMSPEEIAEAQAEIMEKMDPAIINLLKRRSQEKLKKQNVSKLDGATVDQIGDSPSGNQPMKDSNFSPQIGNDGFNMVATTSEDVKNNNGVLEKTGLGNGNLWKAWSERVEAVRGIRFSLEGTVVADESETGNISIGNRHIADSVAERDYLRTEGDPAAAGYTIKEAVQLTRSVIPGQRTLALHLLASVLNKVICHIQQNEVGCTLKGVNQVDKLTDWGAIWAYALGPEPELVLSLRMCLDDNHSSVVLACAKVIECVLSCDMNENFLEISEKVEPYEKFTFSAPVFRSKPEIDVGFLSGGFWKYSAKSSNILSLAEDVIANEEEGEHTIQDDIVVAGQDFAAGLVRMGFLPRLRYLLESDPNEALEECIISVLIAIARHSPTCANAITKCQGLLHMVVHRFSMGVNVEINPSKIKSVTLLKVLAQSDRKNCLDFIKNGSFQVMIKHLYHCTSSLDQWMKLGKENCKLSSALMVEQLRFWKVCIQYGCCISSFSDIFPALCLWLNPPAFENLEENDVLNEFTCISKEAYVVLEAMARKLPDFYSQKHLSNQVSDRAGDEPGTWSWSYVTPTVDLALKWIASMSGPYISKFFKGTKRDLVPQDASVCSLLWVYSAVMHLLSTLLERVNPGDSLNPQGHARCQPWLPEFVPKVGLELLNNEFFSFSGSDDTEYPEELAGSGSFIEALCHIRQQNKNETSLAATCCLHGLLRAVNSIENLIHSAKSASHGSSSQEYSSSREGKILEDGVLKRSLIQLTWVLNVFMKLIMSEWHFMQSVELFGRGGPAPGVGVGWGASGGGFWSMTVLLAQKDAGLLIHLLEIFQMVTSTQLSTNGEIMFAVHRINSILGVCLTIGPMHREILEKAFTILFQVPVFKCLDVFIQRLLRSNRKVKPPRCEYNEEDYLHFSEILASHFKSRWLSAKRKLKSADENVSSGMKASKKGNISLDTIHEGLDMSSIPSEDHSCPSLALEWAHQRLPLPIHWFLSPISTISCNKLAGLQSSSNIPKLVQDPGDITEVAKGGLLYILGLEAMSTFLSPDVPSPIRTTPLIWKLHSLSVILLDGMAVLEDDKTRDVYETLQDLYGQYIDEARSRKHAECTRKETANVLPETGEKPGMEFLRFKSEIHDSYSTFLDTLVEQFSAISYGDLIFGRQVAVYLHSCTEASVRLSAWNALVNAHVLEILPPLEKCLANAEGYLEPIEDHEGILEAYTKCWVSGALDKAAIRGSIAYTLVLHHLSSFIFLVHSNDKASLQNKLARSLLRDYSQNQRHEGMMMDFLQYSLPKEREGLSQSDNVEKRFQVLMEACERNSTLLSAVQKLRSAFVKKQIGVN